MKNLHATQIATRGVISTYGTALASAGFIVKIEDVEEPIRPILGGGVGVPRTLSEKEKCVKITVEFSGQTYETYHCVDKYARLTVKDIEIVHDEDRVISVSIKNLRNP